MKIELSQKLNGWGPLTRRVFFECSKKLGVYAASILVALDMTALKNKETKISEECLAFNLKTDEKTLRKYMDLLEENGFVKITKVRAKNGYMAKVYYLPHQVVLKGKGIGMSRRTIPSVRNTRGYRYDIPTNEELSYNKEEILKKEMQSLYKSIRIHN